jgi:alkylation response protein AidB-like acyl-CoA dehydrogenase
MTELLGGSDVRGSTQTLATQIEGNKYCLHGLKWFTSAIDANITFTLAKIKHKDKTIDNAPTLFFLKLRNQDGTLNNINVIRLKDKMGTKQLPTAELELQGTVAEIASPPKKGITLIMNLANITRLHNITFSVGYMRRMIALLEDYSKKRKVFGKELSQQPLHIIEVSKMKFTFEGNFLFLLQVVKMYSKAELDKNYKNKDLLRLILPIAKLFAARCSEEVCLEGVQGFGGVGYMENSFIPQILRDTIVTSIWEGSINLLSFDFMKVLQSNVKVFENFVAKILKRIKLM